MHRCIQHRYIQTHTCIDTCNIDTFRHTHAIRCVSECIYVVCIYRCIQTHTYIYTHNVVCIYGYIQTHTHIHTSVLYASIDTFRHTHIYTHTCHTHTIRSVLRGHEGAYAAGADMHTHIHKYTHTYMSIYMNTFIHTEPMNKFIHTHTMSSALRREGTGDACAAGATAARISQNKSARH